jgi:hypothetical protein
MPAHPKKQPGKRSGPQTSTQLPQILFAGSEAFTKIGIKSTERKGDLKIK